MISDDNGLPTSIAGLFGVAFGLYARRFAFYGTLALVAFGVEWIVDAYVINDTGLAVGLEIILLAFLQAAVSIGVAFDLAQKPADWSTLFTTASLRWGVVAAVLLVSELFFGFFGRDIFTPTADTGYGLYDLPIVVIWGAISLSTVVAAINPVKSRLTLPFVALGKALAVSARFVNLGRLIVLSALLLMPELLEYLLTTSLLARHAADPAFWGEMPVAMLFTGPLQALCTVFYIDFLRRAKR